MSKPLVTKVSTPRGRYHVGILPCGPVSEGRGSCSASVCHSTNQIKSLLLSHHHSTSALVSEILMSVLQTVQKKK